MKIKFNNPKGQRYLKQFESIYLEDNDSLPSLWWQVQTEEWVSADDTVKYLTASHHLSQHSVHDLKFFRSGEYPHLTESAPRTFKALIRYLKRHTELKGYTVVAQTRYDGCYVTIQL